MRPSAVVVESRRIVECDLPQANALLATHDKTIGDTRATVTVLGMAMAEGATTSSVRFYIEVTEKKLVQLVPL